MNFLIKHKPRSLADLVYADPNVERIVKDTAEKKRNQHIILHGPHGGGKSETARLIMEGRISIEEIDQLSEPIYAKSYPFNDFQPILNAWSWQISKGAGHGCVIIEEIDQFSEAMQQRLRAFMDKHRVGIVVATTNNLHRLDAPLKDRCRCLHLPYPSVDQWIRRAKAVLASENIKLTDEQLVLLLHGFEGSGRSLMDWLEDATISLSSTYHNPC